MCVKHKMETNEMENDTNYDYNEESWASTLKVRPNSVEVRVGNHFEKIGKVNLRQYRNFCRDGNVVMKFE